VYYFNLGLTLGSARYIATGRSLTSMSSNFVDLFTKYARSHFLSAFEIMFFAIVYIVFTTQTGSMPFIQTWPIWLMAFAQCLSPWIFNPRSFQGRELILNLYEFEEWLDPFATNGWQQWHANALKPMRMCTGGRKVVIFLSSKLVPKLLLFTAATAALRIDPVTDGSKYNYAIFRTAITLFSGLTFICVGLIYNQLSNSRLLHEIFGRLRTAGYINLYMIAQNGYLWGLRTGTIFGHIAIVWSVLGNYMNNSREPAPLTGEIPYEANSGAIVVAALAIQVLVIQLLSFIPDEPKGFLFCSKPVL
jgi:hypothetical protein